MLLAPTFLALASVVLRFATQVSSAPTSDTFSGILTESQMLTWLSTTDAELTFIGKPIPKQGGLNKRDGADVMVVYCTGAVENVCGSPCSVYTGGTACLEAPFTNCLKATANVGFCNFPFCDGTCNQLSDCRDRLDDDFCYTPGTSSILVPFV